jgi:hypothetical protein
MAMRLRGGRVKVARAVAPWRVRVQVAAMAGYRMSIDGLMIDRSWNPAVVDPSLDSRAATFENPTGARGAGGSAHGGRKGAPNKRLEPGERVVLADIEGPGMVRHIWMTFPPARPEKMRALLLEIFYDDADEPSASVPCLDFFGLPHGRPVPYASALTTAQEGRGFNSYVPMPFDRRIRIELVNAAPRATILYYQVDYTLQPELPADLGRLHVTFRRENPTVMRRDFVIADGLHGPGRFLGCNVGVRVIDPGVWYGEGEVKIYRDGDDALPTICGTGLEDYVGSAWGMGAHSAPYGGAPLIVSSGSGPNPELVGFYRWHVPDPVMFERSLRVTIQQIGAMFFAAGQEDELARYEQTNPAAGDGWHRDLGPDVAAWGIAERVDDYCATAYVYCLEAQPVPRVDVDAALADIERRDFEPSPRQAHLPGG